MKPYFRCSLLLVVCSMLVSFAALGKADSTSGDKGRFVIKIAAGLGSADWLKSVNPSKLSEAIRQPDVIYSAALQYSIGRDVAVSAVGFYSNGAYNSTVATPEDKIGLNWQIEHTITNYHSTYKVMGGAVECQVIYDRIYKTSRVLYCSAGLGYVYSTGAVRTVEARYGPYNNVPAYSYSYSTGGKDNVKLHFTLVGIRGGKDACWFAELGYGYKGVVNAGLALKI